MTKKSEIFTIGDTQFISYGWSPLKQAARNLPTIGKAFAVPISFMISASQSGNFADAIPQAMYMLFEQLEEQDIEKLFATILQDVINKKTDKPVDMDEDFNNIDDLLLLVGSVLKQHYGCLIEGKGFGGLMSVMVPLSKAV